MSQDCSNCIKMKHLEEKVNKIESELCQLNKTVVDIDKQNAVDNEKMDNFNKTVEGIQKGISDIIVKIELLEKKPIGRFEKITAAIIGGVITYIITMYIKTFFGG